MRSPVKKRLISKGMVSASGYWIAKGKGHTNNSIAHILFEGQGANQDTN